MQCPIISIKKLFYTKKRRKNAAFDANQSMFLLLRPALKRTMALASAI